MGETFFTIGHSNRTLVDFLELLHESSVELIVDVRRLPGWTRYPQFNEDTLAASVANTGVDFRRLEGLTGRRPVNRDTPFMVNAWWENRSFHNYADHALSAEFRTALDELRTWGATVRAAVMCSEAVWWRCHRRIITDYLLASGEEVQHILGTGQVSAAQLSRGAVPHPDGSITYPADAA